MEHMGYEISHGNRLGFRLRGQPRFMYPGRKNPLFTEDGIRAAIQGNLEDIETGRRPAMIYRPPYQPYKKHPKFPVYAVETCQKVRGLLHWFNSECR